MEANACPDRQVLAALVAGNLGEEWLEGVARHVDACPACLAQAQALDPGPDAALAGLGQPIPVDPVFQEPECVRGLTSVPVRGSQSTLPETPNTADAPWSARSATTASGWRYQAVELHARGGLGEVHQARDEELRRRVALKRIRPERAADPANRRRFLREAEITGRLEHPGVVPVYGLAEDERGRPCYAMRFVEGETLQDAIGRFHAQDQPGRDPGERQLALRGLLGRFVAVCNAVAYAHSRGVVHRDLKPANVMLGPYGETLVVDWGLAKQEAGGREERDASGLNSDFEPVGDTQAGQTLGTPAYMSPEQAAGLWDQVGPASDIYSLGATLYTLLTGQPPFAGEPAAILEQVRQGQFLRPRQRKAAVPPALEAACVKAMAREPGVRYPTALALAAEVEHWLADEPVAAFSEGWLARGRRWARHHRAWVASVAAAALVAGLLGGVGWWWRVRAQAETARAADHILIRAAELCDREEWSAALLEARRAEALLEGGGGAEPEWERVRALLADLELVQRLEDIRRRQTTEGAGALDPAGADREYAEAFRDYGLDVAMQTPAEILARIRARPIRNQLTAAFDYWAGVRQAARPADQASWQRLTALAQAADQDPERVSYAASFYHLGRVLEQQGRLDEAVAAWQKAVRLHKGCVEAHADLGRVLEQRGRLDDALAAWRMVVQLQPRSARAHLNLGHVWQRKGRLDEALDAYQQAARLEPNDPDAFCLLGHMLERRWRLEEAVRACQRAIELKPNLAGAHCYLGNARVKQGRPDQAVAAYAEAVRLNRNYLEGWIGLGHALELEGRLEEAEAACRKAVALQSRYDDAHCYLGDVLRQQRRPEEAVAAYQAALQWNRECSEAHCGLGLVFLEQGRFSQALASLKRGDALGRRDPHWSLPSADWVREAERMAKLDAQLPAIRNGEMALETAAARAEAARCCCRKRLYATAVRFFKEALAAEPSWPDDLPRGWHFDAAAAAAQAADGTPEDAVSVDAEQRSRWRRQALDWLRADLTVWASELDHATVPMRLRVRRRLRFWQQDPHLAGLRNAAAVAKLPPEERALCLRFWEDVKAVLQRVDPQ